MPHASCLCGAVTWTAEGPFEFMSHCHCARCRKTHGTAYATYVAAAAEKFRLHGEQHVARWQSSPGFFRCFCARCGSVVPSDAPDCQVFMPAANFDDDLGVRPLAHIFVASKAPWFGIADSLPQFDTYPEGIDAPVLADRPPLDPPGKPRGSCLCGAVTYILKGVPLLGRYCHCSRCRKARSAAFASNLFTTGDGVVFTRGEEKLTNFKVPDAQFFTHVFCSVCGSSMPRVDPVRGVAVIPMGGLDDDPDIAPQAHIFVASKAPWDEITDDLPQHPEAPPR